MKKAIFLFSLFASLVLISNQGYSQIRKIPSSATETLKQKYPAADNVEWKDQLTHYSAKFQLEDKDYEVHFDNDGNLKESLVKLDESEIPAAVREGFDKSKYSDWTIDKVEKIESSDGKLQYRLQVKSGDIKKKILYFNPDGKLTRDHITLWF
jgi:hypothetical protein